MMGLKLDNQSLLTKATDKNMSNQDWASFMRKTAQPRLFYSQRFKSFQTNKAIQHKNIKAAISVSMGLGLFFLSPAPLLLGASLTISLGRIALESFKLDAQLVIDETEAKSEDTTPSNFDEKEWSMYRQNWINMAKQQAYSAKEKQLNYNIETVSLCVIVAFATAIGIASGISSPFLIINSILFIATLHDTLQEEAEPYFEGIQGEHALPAFSI